MNLPFPGVVRSWARTLALLLAAGSASLFSGCGGGESNNSSANNTNTIATNTAANTMSNTATNSTSNTIVRTGNIGLPNLVVDADMLKGALKERLRHDNERFMPDGGWDSDAWLDTNVGAFYKNDDETTKLMICDITDDVLRPLNKKLKPFARQKLYDGVSSNMKCRLAINLMFKATLNTTSIEPVP